MERTLRYCVLSQAKCILAKRLLSTHKIPEETALIDYTEVIVEGGRGGQGCASLLNLNRNRVKPDGADGGDGGAVIFQSCSRRHDFAHVPQKIKGHSGTHGQGSNKKGQRGDNTVITLPVGSIIGCQLSQKPLAVLENEGDCWVAAEGGSGGKGNTVLSLDKEGHDRYFCREKELGNEGQITELYLEMKIIADVGLVGLPNAGKSSLLRAISAAKPRVAAYPFTTLRPHIGVVHYDGYHRLRMADIPGLIEGSSLGHGLGISFLKHIERCKNLLYVVDVSNPNEDPIKTIEILESELNAFKCGMSDTICGIVANKIDQIHVPDTIIELGKAFPHYPIIPASALLKRNITSVRKVLEPLKYLHIPER